MVFINDVRMSMKMSLYLFLVNEEKGMLGRLGRLWGDSLTSQHIPSSPQTYIYNCSQLIMCSTRGCLLVGFSTSGPGKQPLLATSRILCRSGESVASGLMLFDWLLCVYMFQWQSVDTEKLK